MQEVQDPARQTGTLDPSSLASLPVGLVKEVNQHQYIVAIDSAFFHPNGAYFNAYTAFDFPGTTEKVAFAAKRIQFNPKGVVGGTMARLQLVSEHLLSIGPKTQLYLPANGLNYVEWDCNGFQSLHLQGEFRFSGDLLVPDSSTSLTPYVSARFEIHANDIYNVITQVSFSPFSVRGLKDFVFQINQAVVDLSDFANSPGMVFPTNYANVYGSDLNLWRGFYVKEFTIKLPPEINRSEGAPISLTAQHLIIDDAGVSGIFGVNNLLSLGEGDMYGWGFSVDQFNIGLVANEITAGLLKGKVQVPALDNNAFAYTASIHKNTTTGKSDYLFALQPASNVSMSCFFADVTLFNTSVLGVQKKYGKFKPFMILNGNMAIGHNSFSLPSIGFQQLTLVTEAPYITNGLFTLSSAGTSENLLGNFPIVIDNLAVGLYNQQPVIAADLGFNLGDGSTNLSVTTNVKVVAKFQTQPVNYTLSGATEQPKKVTWSFDKLKVNDIRIQVTSQPFTLDGLIAFKENDPTYGKGFFGALVMDFGDVLPAPVTVTGCFGRTSFRYWSVDAAVPLNAPIPGTGIKINQIRGGLSYHMAGSKSNAQLINDIATNASGTSSGQIYTPNESIGIGFRAGAGFAFQKENVLNGDIVLAVTFNSSGSLNNISLNGNAYMLANKAERTTAGNRVFGSVNALFDNVNDIFSVDANLAFDFAGSATGYAYTKLYISPDKWYFWLGRPSAPCFVNIHNLATVNGYFMVGQEMEPMSPPPAHLLSLINDYNLDDQRDVGKIATGDGFAVGVNFSQYFDKSIGWDNFELYGAGSVGAGFDMTMIKYGPGTRCMGSSTYGIGFKNWYLQGRLYAWLSLNAGLRGKVFGNDFDVTILSGNAALLLEGKLPKPTYVAGYIHLDATVLEFIHVEMDFDFDFGNNCTIVSG